jgi:hypothetical protein
MKALSIQQPWAWFIVNGYKDVENRSWPTSFRGPVLIHAGKKFDEDGWLYLKNGGFARTGEKAAQRLKQEGNITPRQMMQLCGGIVGVCEIVDCVKKSDSPWFFGEYGFVIKNAKPIPFMPYKGKLGFFDVSELINADV